MPESKGKAKKGLGRGLGAFFDNVSAEIENTENAKNTVEEKSGVKKIKIRDIEPNPEQPRRNFDKEKLEELAESIKEHGLIQPIIVKKKENGMYIIIAGERRWRASKLAGLSEVPCIEGDYSDREIMELALIENLQREDLNPIEEAEGYLRLMKSFGLKQEEVASCVGKSRSAVANSLRLNNLCDEVKKMVTDGSLSQGHARALIVLDKDKQILAAQKIIAEDLNVRQTEKLVAGGLEKQEVKKIKVDENVRTAFLDIEKALSDKLCTKVKIKAGKNKGKIEIEYYSNEELENLVSKIQN